MEFRGGWSRSALPSARRDASTLLFENFLDDYEREELQKRGLTNKGLPSFLKAIRKRFRGYTLDHVARSPKLAEEWMESLRERDVPLSHTTNKTRRVVWSRRTWNAYRTRGIRLFNWAKHPKRRLTTENPFLLIDRQKGEQNRETRITEEQQEALFCRLRTMEDGDSERLG